MSRKASPIALVQGVDKFELANSPPLDTVTTDQLSAHCDSDVIVMNRRMKFNPLYGQALGFVSPASTLWPALGRAFGRDTMVIPTYAELATDVIFDAVEQAEAALTRFLAAARFLYLRPNPLRDRNIYYLASLSGKAGRLATRPAIYADCPSKLPSSYKGYPALHFENRISGAQALAKVGISSWLDLEHFDHRAYWKRKLHMHEVPSRTRLGEILSGRDDRKVTDKALRERARGFRREVISLTHVTDGTPPPDFIFQLAAHLRPELARAVPSVDIYQWVESLRV